MDVSLSELRELVMDREAWHADSWGGKEVDMTEQLNWTELMEHFVKHAGDLNLKFFKMCHQCLVSNKKILATKFSYLAKYTKS